MRAVVLVGGFGTRLQPLTFTTPKTLLPVGQKTMLEHVLGHLGRHGVSDVVLSIGFKPDAFLAAFPSGTCAGVRLDYAVEPEPLDTAGAIRFAAKHAGFDEPFVVVNGDVLTDLDVRALVDLHHTKGGAATIHLTPVDDPSAFGVVSTDAHGQVLAFIEKPTRGEAPTNLVNAGTYVLDASVLDLIPGDRRVSIERETFPILVERGTLYAMPTDDYWLDAGRPDLYLRANLDAVAGVRVNVLEPAIAATARVEGGAVLDGAIVGPGAVVAGGATVRRSLVMAGASIGRGALLDDTIIGVDASVGDGASLTSCVIGDAVDVAPGAVLTGARVPEPA